MVQRAAPLNLFVTLIPKKLKNAIDTTLPNVVHCSCGEAAISWNIHSHSAAPTHHEGLPCAVHQHLATATKQMPRMPCTVQAATHTMRAYVMA